MILIALLFPGLSFLLRGKLISAVFAFILQIIAIITFFIFHAGVLLWAILALWAVLSFQNAKKEKRQRRMMKFMQKRQSLHS